MSNNYIWEFGFDFNSAPDPNNNSQPYLPNDLVLTMELIGNFAIGDSQNLKVGDAISFNAFNITSEASAQGYSITSVWIEFIETEGAVTPYPFNPTSPILANGDTQNPIAGTINIGSSSATIQILSLGQAPQTASSFVFKSQLPRWEIISSSLPVTNTGTFGFTIVLTVIGPDGQQIFRVDPEMIVEGPPTPESQDSLESPAIRR